MQNPLFRNTFSMDLKALLSLEAEELAKKILERRQFLSEALPDIESRMAADADELAPKVEKLRLARDAASNKVADLKKRRNEAQSEARVLLQKSRELREVIEKSGGMKNLDPKWAKEKLEEQLEEIEDQIEKKALSLNDERKLLSKRKELLRKNADWLNQRKKDNPEIADYVEVSKKMNKLFTQANKLHQEMLTYVEKNEPIHAEFTEMRGELRNSMRQVERSRALIKQSESAIQFWKNTLENGFDDLLKSAKNVEKGGASSIRRRSADLPIASKDVNGGEEE
tara:strand:+ start:415 stop:1263 length:849 start_codon:yes stop_codon:yes gene_type:complete